MPTAKIKSQQYLSMSHLPPSPPPWPRPRFPNRNLPLSLPHPRKPALGFRPSDFFRISNFGPRIFTPAIPVLILLSLALSGCVCPKTHTAIPAPASTIAHTRKFDFQHDTFAFPNELLWIYEFDSNGKWVSHKRDPKPSYWLRCFVLARSAKQFFVNARFAPEAPAADES